jgi:diaminopimelate decarboxylase
MEARAERAGLGTTEETMAITEFGPYLKVNEEEQLEIEGLSVVDLAEQYGTPLFVISENTIRARIRRMQKAFTDHYPNEMIICVGMKAQWGLAVRRVVVKEGAGGDAFGLGELTVAMMAGSDPRKIVLNGANKAEDALRAAIDTGILIQVDHEDELEKVEALAGELGKTARVSLRIRLPLNAIEEVVYVDPRYPEGISPTYWERTFKFGLDPENYFAEVGQALTMKNISLEGVMYHGGIPRRAGYFREETEELMDMIGQIKAKYGWAPQYLNIGGGFVPERVGQEIPPSIEEYAQVIGTAIVSKCEEYGLPVPVLLAEPGRYCVDSAGIWVVKVGSLKDDRNLAKKKWVYVDGNTNEMGDPFDPYNRVHHVVIANDPNREGTEVVEIAGQTCNAADVLVKDRELAKMRIGDTLAFLEMGAYNEGFACQSNAIPRSATVMVSNGRAAVVRRRETVSDVLARESVPSWLMT